MACRIVDLVGVDSTSVRLSPYPSASGIVLRNIHCREVAVGFATDGNRRRINDSRYGYILDNDAILRLAVASGILAVCNHPYERHLRCRPVVNLVWQNVLLCIFKYEVCNIGAGLRFSSNFVGEVVVEFEIILVTIGGTLHHPRAGVAARIVGGKLNIVALANQNCLFGGRIDISRHTYYINIRKGFLGIAA